MTLVHTPLQNIYNVLAFKKQIEEKRGELDAKSLSLLYNKEVRFANPEDKAACSFFFLGVLGVNQLH